MSVLGLVSKTRGASEGCNSLVRALTLYLAISSLLIALASAQNYYEDKKNDPNSRPFYMGSRYGRSGQQTKVLVAPRTDRFFMGSRYGKRGGFMAEGAEETNPNELALDEPLKTAKEDSLEDILGGGMGGAVGANGNKGALKCAYLGIGNLFRCLHRDLNTMPSR